eukprot:2030210-Amphidinium_carterae.1
MEYGHPSSGGCTLAAILERDPGTHQAATNQHSDGSKLRCSQKDRCTHTVFRDHDICSEPPHSALAFL